ncbi:MAG TPA: YXWGXW repeat-containing protein [Acidobacteriaceae bacterium]|nr:YXWGXW repeat-containing protein [Acidobacteriaceae bacterium]
MSRVLRVALLAFCAVMFMQPTFGQEVAVSVSFGPPALPVYDLPPCPADGYLWTPGYWAWDPDYGYYWVPGTWVEAPEPGFLWTPGWWGWGDGGYIWHEGWWGPQVGFYGGINYGFGYFGVGFVGGRWDGGHFRYNTAVLNVDRTIIRNTYVDRTVIVNNNNHVSFNGGEGGVPARPTPEEERAGQERHMGPVQMQQQHAESARSNPEMRASQNHGAPAVAATSRPGEFEGRGVVRASAAGAPYHEPPNAPHGGGEGMHPAGGDRGTRPEAGGNGGITYGDAKDLQPHQITQPNTGNPKLDKKYLQQQQKMVDKQNQEHQALEQKQEQDHERAQQKNYNQQQKQQMEQKHAQQTQKLEQRHAQQAQRLQQRQAPPRKPQ